MMEQRATVTTARTFSFTIPGRIGGKQRAGRMRLPGGGVRSFNPAKTESQEAMVRHLAALAMRDQKVKMLTGPVSLVVTVFRRTPASWSKKRAAAAVWVTGKPDCDNIIKLIADALNGVAWQDDAQIALLGMQRLYDNDGERVAVAINELEAPKP